MLKLLTVLLLQFVAFNAKSHTLSDFYSNLNSVEPTLATRNCYVKHQLQRRIYDEYYNPRKEFIASSEFQAGLKGELDKTLEESDNSSNWVSLQSHLLSQCLSKADIEYEREVESCVFWDSIHDNIVGHKDLGKSKEETIEIVSKNSPNAHEKFLDKQINRAYSMDIPGKEIMYKFFLDCTGIK